MLNTFLDKFVFTNGLRYTHYNFYLLNLGFALVPMDVLVGIAAVSNPLVNQQLYAAVKKNVRDSFLQSFQLGATPDKSVVFVEDFLTAAGFGLVKHADLDWVHKRAIIVVNDNPVARSLQGKALKPVDAVLRGFLAGAFSHLFQSDVDCIEKSCMALGSQACEFVIQPQSHFDFSKPEPREQLVLKD